MNLQQSTTIDPRHPGADNTSQTSLQGRWLLIARVGWVVLTLLILTLNAAMLPQYDAILQAHCQPSPQCFAIQLTASDQTLMHQFGLSLGFLAAYQTTLDAISVLLCCALGTLLFLRKSSDRMALFCAFMLVLFSGAGFTDILQNALAPLSSVWFTLVSILDLLGQSSFMIFFFLFPSGSFAPRWTRWVAPCVVLYWMYAIFFTDDSSQFSWYNLVFFALLLCIVGTQVYRYRRLSSPRERQQTKWVIFGFSIGILGFILAVVLGNTFGVLNHSSVLKVLVGETILYGFLLLIPVSMVIAVLRSRLWDIDILINRTLVYGSLTSLLALLYVGLIFALHSLLGAIIKQSNNDVAIVVSTLAIAALFQPLRRRIQEAIDHRFYRRKYDAAKTLQAFSVTLRHEVDLEQLREHLLALVQETMQPTHVSLWLRPPEPTRKHQMSWISSALSTEDGEQA